MRLSIHIKQTLSIDRGSADAIKPYQLFVKKETFHGTEKTINISQSGEEDLAAATEDYQDGMHVDEVIREVTTETIPKESSQATLVTGGEHGDDDAEGETAADADDDDVVRSKTKPNKTTKTDRRKRRRTDHQQPRCSAREYLLPTTTPLFLLDDRQSPL